MIKKLLVCLLTITCIFSLTGCSKKYEGTLSGSGVAKDEEFGIEVNAPILIRKVETIQNYSDEKGSRLVFSSDELENNGLNTNIKTQIFTSSDINLKGEALDEKVIEAIVKNCEAVKVTNLPRENGNKFNLTGDQDGDAYVTASNQWELGDIRVSFYYISEGTLVDVKVKK